ncbi:MAG: gfo/Idh/MocA family oxidoreductase, partial [Muribaculaceae bacterium]|nr:gfo/Idh/MocA family oxidoreductase [Muribaculaceae bacterium]
KTFDPNGVSVIYGTKDTMVVGTYGYDPILCSGREVDVPMMCREVPGDNHQQDWIRACKESPDSRVPSESDFMFSGPLNEMVTMGVAAVRLQDLNQWLEWDGQNMRFTNIPDNATIRDVVEDKFQIHDGHPTFDRTYTEPVNANEYAARLIKPVYREGWTLPEMPVL